MNKIHEISESFDRSHLQDFDEQNNIETGVLNLAAFSIDLCAEVWGKARSTEALSSYNQNKYRLLYSLALSSQIKE